MEGGIMRRLELLEQELALISELDRVRDTREHPDELLSGIVQVICNQFHLELCQLYLLNRETGSLELKITAEHSRHWQKFGLEIPLERIGAAMRTQQPKILAPRDLFPEEALAGLPPEMRLGILPIFMGETPLGALLLARVAQPFNEDDVHLLEVAEMQIDSAVMQAYRQLQLIQRNKELETIYRFDRIRDRNLPFDEMLDIVVHELRQVINAEMGFVMLYNPKGEQLEMRACTDASLLQDSQFYQDIVELANRSVQQTELLCTGVAISAPLILQGRVIGVFGAMNLHSGRRFTREDRRLLHAIVSQMDTAILESLEYRRLRQVLGRSLDAHVLEQLLAKPDVGILQGERSVISVLYADLRGSTHLAEHLAPEILVEFMNDYLGQMTDVVLAHQGTLDKFVGDEVMALFNAPMAQADHALRSVIVGLEMQKRHQQLVEQWAARGIQTTGLGIGIATGELIVGEIGCAKRTDYTVMGRAANLGARICSLAKSGQVLVAPTTYEMIKDRVQAIPIPDQRFKGIDEPITVYHITEVH